MSASTTHLPAFTRPTNLRPFDVRRDLLAVADLVELCFAPTLDSDGYQYIRQMRQAARAGRWLASPPASLEAPLMGMVWVEDGVLVGNLSLIPQYLGSRTRYLIANVAVHPDYRGHGIASQLTRAALEDVRSRGRAETWLQVDQTNATAIELYTRLGFVEKMRRTSWRGWPQAAAEAHAPSLRIRKRVDADWAMQKAWLDAIYPADVRWHLPLKTSTLRPGWRASMQRLFGDPRSMHWSATEGRHLRAVLSWQSSTLEADRLWLAADPHDAQPPLADLLAAASRQLRRERKLALNYPSGLAAEAIQAAGFSALRTLIWMRYPWEVFA